MSFLSHTELTILSELAALRNGWYTNSNGNKSKGKLWIIGENECTISGCELKQSKFNDNYITVEFKRAPLWIDGLKTKVSFIPHTEFYFNEKGLIELCAACGHTLGERPPEMNLNTYLSHVYRRVNTFIGTKIKVVISSRKEAATDTYGETKMKNLIDELVFYKMKIESYHHVKEHIKIDYEKLAQVVLNI